MLIATSLNIGVSRGPLPTTIARVARAGFDGVDFHFCDLLDACDWTDDRALAAYIEPLGAAAKDHRLKWVQGHGPMFNMFGESPFDTRARELCVPSIRAAGRLGVPWMVFHSDVFPGPFDLAHRKRIVDANMAFFRSLLPECERNGVGIAIENIFDAHARNHRGCPRFFGTTPEELCELVDKMNHPLIGICWDTGHAQMSGHDQRAAIESLGSRLKALHIQENDGESDDHLLPFTTAQNGVKWHDVAQALGTIGYGGAFTFEIRNAFDAVPDELFDDHLQLAVKIARHITGYARR